jgi:RNA polymerase sigma-70 factor (ECF subfamily)
MVRKEQRLLIERCMEELPENQQLAFRLREVEGMSYREIAETLAISEDLVKISLFRARKKMKELLTGYGSYAE